MHIHLVVHFVLQIFSSSLPFFGGALRSTLWVMIVSGYETNSEEIQSLVRLLSRNSGLQVHVIA